MKNLPKPVSFGLVAFLASWQATDFALDYRSLVGAVVAGLMGFLNPGLTKTVYVTPPPNEL